MTSEKQPFPVELVAEMRLLEALTSNDVIVHNGRTINNTRQLNEIAKTLNTLGFSLLI